MKIYISGKITGLEHQVAYKIFEDAENNLKSKLNCEVINPMKLEHNHDQSWENFMKQDLKELLDCDYIFLLDNWKFSKGARLELLLADELKIEVINKIEKFSNLIFN